MFLVDDTTSGEGSDRSSASVTITIKRSIELASEGLSDPVRLCRQHLVNGSSRLGGLAKLHYEAPAKAR